MAKVAVVTGSNKGIGFACVRALCQKLKPEDVVYLTSRNQEAGQKAVDQLKSEGLNPRYHQLDISDKKSVEGLRDDLLKEHGGLDILINNAAIAFKAKDTTPFPEQAKVTNAVNFYDTLNVCHQLFPLLRPNARIVNVSSFVAKWAYGKTGDAMKVKFDNAKTEKDVCELVDDFILAAQSNEHTNKGYVGSAYGFSKLALSTLSRIQAEELAKLADKPGILLVSADPGAVQTDMSSQGGSKNIDEGADTLVWAALLPEGSTEYRGHLVSDRKIMKLE